MKHGHKPSPEGLPGATAPAPLAAGEITQTRTTHLPTWSSLQVATKQSASFGASGDFFEVFRHRDGSVSTVMADVCGKGPAAAAVVAAVRPVLRHCLARGDSPGAALTALNDWMTRQPLQDRFVTAVAVRIDVEARRAEVAGAGHLGPFVRRRSGAVEALTPAGGVPLGMLPGQTYQELALQLEPDDAIVLVTDGITDPLATESDVLGEHGLMQRLAVAPHGTADICHALLADDQPARDDATVLVLQLPGAAPLVEAA